VITAAAQAAATTSSVGPAVLVVIAVIIIWRVSVGGRGEIKLRLLAWLLLPVIVWALVAAHSPAEGGQIASGAASGIGTAISALGKLFGG
jgi:uncharacterized membrane protein